MDNNPDEEKPVSRAEMVHRGTTVTPVDGDTIAVAPGLTPVSRSWRFEVSHEALPLDIRGRLELDLAFDGGRFTFAELSYLRKDGGRPITSEVVRSIPLEPVVDHLTSLLRAKVGWDHVRQLVEPEWNLQGTELTAALYRTAALTGEPSTAYIAHFLGVSNPTAQRRIAAARSEGLLPHPGSNS